MIRDNQSRRVRQGAVVLALSLPFIVSGALSLGAASPAGGSEDPAWNFGNAKGVSTPETGSQIRDRIDRARGEIAEAGVGEDAANESVQSVAMDLSEARGQLEAILDASPAVRIKGHIFAAAQAIPTGDQDSVIEQIGSAQHNRREQQQRRPYRPRHARRPAHTSMCLCGAVLPRRVVAALRRRVHARAHPARNSGANTGLPTATHDASRDPLPV